MIKIEMNIGRENIIEEFDTKAKALEFMSGLIDNAIESELDYLDDIDYEDLEAIDRIESLKKLDRNDLLELEFNADLILGDGEVVITEFDYYLSDLLAELGFNYDKSTMSKSLYVENKDGLLVRISDHKTPMLSQDYGHRTPDIELIYRDCIVNPMDINKYFGSYLGDDVVILL